jgi:hypothetical protein
VLLFSIVTFACLGTEGGGTRRKIWGFAAGIAALFAMGPGLLVPFVLLGLAGLRAWERRQFGRAQLRELWPGLALLVVAVSLYRAEAAHTNLHAKSIGQFLTAFARAAAWPHVWTPIAAIGLNFPVAWLLGSRLLRRRTAASGEDFILLLAGWATAMAVAMAWTRGGSDEFDGGVPSRYADFLVLLTLANAWSVVQLVREGAVSRRTTMRTAGAVWVVFLCAGWIGLSAEVMHRLVLPRLRDRDAPVRVAIAFQRTRDPAVFDGQPLLYLPDRNPQSIGTVLDDPRMRGRLPPSLQRGQPIGPLSRGIRAVLHR